MDKIVFKGIKQVTMDVYQSATNKKGYLWFVRETIQKQEGSQSPFEENRFHIYFGDKKYGDFWGGLYESIGALVEAINQQSIAISNKQEIIGDLETIRTNAALGATALQTVPSEYVTETELDSKGFVNAGYVIEELKMKSDTGHTHTEYLTEHQDISGKQDVISDLATIRSNAAKGATALQSVPSEYVTETELGNKNYATSSYVVGELAKKSNTGHTHSEYLTEHQDISGKQDVISDLATIRSGAALGATALQSVPAEYITETELNGKGYLTEHQNISHLATKAELTGYTTDSEFTTLSNTVSQKADANVLNGYSTTGHTHTEFTTLQNNINTKVNASDYNAKINELNATDTSLENRITTVENYTVPDARANVLWIGTSIPAGDIQHGNNGTTQSTTTNLGYNNYPKMVADALGFNLYNNSRGSSFVCFYPSNEDGTANWAGKDWSEYSSEVWKGYSLSASFAQVDEKFGPNGLNCPQWLINNFKSYSYESLIIPYIDGTLASCDTVVIDHGYNDRQVIINEASWHPGDGETQFAVGAGRNWLLKLQDPFETTLETEGYFQGKWWNDESVSSKKHYMSAMIFLAKKIWAVNPRIKIIIGNYFTSKSNVFGAEFGNDRLGEFVHLANSAIASWLRCQCVDVWHYTGIYNRNLAAGNDYQIFCPDNVHPHSDSTGRSNRIIAGVYINALRGICYI